MNSKWAKCALILLIGINEVFQFPLHVVIFFPGRTYDYKWAVTNQQKSIILKEIDAVSGQHMFVSPSSAAIWGYLWTSKMLQSLWWLHKSLYTWIQCVFTIYLALRWQSHNYISTAGTLDFCNQYVNCISKKMYCVLFLCIQQMNGCEPCPDLETHQFYCLGHHSNDVVRAAMIYCICTKNEHMHQSINIYYDYW